MSTEVLTRDSAPLVRPLGHVMAQAPRPGDAYLPVDKPLLGNRESDSAQLTKAIFEDFVRLVERIPKVWAVYLRSDYPIVHVWTYVDSSNWRDRSPVYNAEWDMLNRYPKTPFDFNVALAAAGSEDFEGENTAFVFKR
jgi:hypothetical protein